MGDLSLYHKHHVVLFIFTIFTSHKRSEFYEKNIWGHEKLKTLQSLLAVCSLCGNSILYKYQVTLLFFFNSCLLSNKISKDTTKFL